MTEYDLKYFGKILKENNKNDDKEIQLITYLLQIKNGSSDIKKQAMLKLTDRFHSFGAELLLKKLLPLIIDPHLDQYEKHNMVKILERVIYYLNDDIKPYAQKILSIISPMLRDEDFLIRIQGRELISNLAKGVGLSTMILIVRQNIDNPDSQVRELTSECFAIATIAMTLPKVIPFIQAICKSKKSIFARHTGTKIIMYIAKMMGIGVLPHLKQLILCLQPCLKDDIKMIKISASLSISELAKASKPFGIEYYDILLKDVWNNLVNNKGRIMAATLKALGSIIPLMKSEHAYNYNQMILQILIKEFESPEDEMKKIILRVLNEAFQRREINKQFVKENIFEQFWPNFWLRRLCVNRGTSFRVIETTTSLAKVVGVAPVLYRLTFYLKEDDSCYRKITMNTIKSIIDQFGIDDVSQEIKDLLVDSSLFAFHQQKGDEDNSVLEGLASVIKGLKSGATKYLSQFFINICLRMKAQNSRIRQQTAALISKLVESFYYCGGNLYLKKLCQVLYENLGEEFPLVLSSILKALNSIIEYLEMESLEPPIEEILPTLTPILKNRNEDVQYQLVELIGNIARHEESADKIQPKEWIRICMDLLDLFNCRKKETRKQSINTFGFIARAIGPSDVLVTLISNLKVQDRQMRICTAVAIAVIAETCGPFTVLPALMNEYRMPLNHVQNGILKTLSFMFEYIAQMSKDYIQSLVPLLEHALVSKDLVHKQIACNSLKNLSMGVYGYSCEKYLLHLFNYIFPNIFENSPHIKNGVFETFEALKLVIGPGEMLLFLLQGLFHPARRVREVYWSLYNNLYIGSQGQLPAFYPQFQKLQKDPLNTIENYYLIQLITIKILRNHK